MKVKIEETVEAPLLSRKNIRATIAFEGPTPSRKDVIDALAKELDAKAELIVLQRVDTKFGTTEAEVLARLYDSEDALKEFEPEHMIKRIPKPEAKEDAGDAESSASESESGSSPAENSSEKADEKEAAEAPSEKAESEEKSEEKQDSEKSGDA